ncbi:MAG: glycerol-3-phosphate dehydrogenase subunit GlpB [Bacteroidales bacterium]|nr:glycerol-3-phosphate dehydrogenase subunit GlpB [Bacteroidales bacterium]
MKFDTIIIGGGLSGLVCGIKLQKAGQKCAIVSAGQSAMHFSSGTFDLLGRLPDGRIVERPLEALSSLDENHPYSIIGKERVSKYAGEAPVFFRSCGINVTGTPEINSWRITPTGERKPAWLTLDDFTPLKSKDSKIGDKILIINILGYLDFNTKFLADSFEKQGSKCRIASLKLNEMERLRKNPSEMRSTNIARVMDRDGIWEKAAEQVKDILEDEDLVVLPAVFGLKDVHIIDKIREAIGIRTIFAATMPPSVPGIRSQMTLKSEFEKAGGKFFIGDTVTDADFDEDGKVKSIRTVNFGNIKLYADQFVLASGSFFSKGLIASPDNIYEPVFGADLCYDSKREKWFDRNFWNRQAYISFGAKIDRNLNVSIEGRTVTNLYAIGSLTGGSNTLYEGCGGGVAIISAMAAADEILEKTERK